MKRVPRITPRLKLGTAALALTASVVLGNSGSGDPDERDRTLPANQATAGNAQSQPDPSDTTGLALDLRRRGAAATGVLADAFASRSWAPRPVAVKPPPPPPPPPPPAPEAPPLPYAYIGKWTEEGRGTVYYLERGTKVIAAVPGQALDVDYRFEAAAASELTIVYLPLDTRQTIRTGD